MPYIQKSFTFEGKRYYVKGKTEKEVEEKIIHKKLALQRQVKSIKFGDWFMKYMKAYKSNILKTTVDTYMSTYRNHLSQLSDKYILDITPLDCQIVLNEMVGMSKAYIDFARGLLRDSLDKAIDNGYALSNPCKNVTSPKGTKTERRALTTRERSELEPILAKNGKKYLFCRIVYYCGLRPSEVAKLKGKDIRGQNIHVRGTKTKNATRTVPVPNNVFIPFVDDEEYLFKSYKGHIGGAGYQYYWEKIKEEFYTDATLYCLRHDYCTRLQEAGVPIDVARRLMGHSSISLTSRIYTHANEKSFEDARNSINRYVELSKCKNPQKR